MPRPVKDFAQTVAELGFELPMVVKLPAPPPAPDDTLDLSLQAGKALRPRPEAGEKGPAPVLSERREDMQGNRVLLSCRGRILAENGKSDVAWETRLPERH